MKKKKKLLCSECEELQQFQLIKKRAKRKEGTEANQKQPATANSFSFFSTSLSGLQTNVDSYVCRCVCTKPEENGKNCCCFVAGAAASAASAAADTNKRASSMPETH